MVKKSACNAGDVGSILGSGRSPGRGNGNLLQHSCLENSMDRGDWRLQSMGSQSDMTELLNNNNTDRGIRIPKLKFQLSCAGYMSFG